MASVEETTGAPATADDNTKVVADVINKVVDDTDNSQTDPDLTSSKDVKDGPSSKGEEDLKSKIIISGVVIAVIGAIFAIAKKMKGG